jgi:hypothetical protein
LKSKLNENAKTKASVVLMCTEGPASRVLANVLRSTGSLDLIVHQRKYPLRWAARRWLRYLAGIARLRVPISFRVPLEQRVERSLLYAAQRRVTEHYPVSFDKWPLGVPRIVVDDINGKRCKNILKMRRPALIAVFSTKILKREIFDQAQLGAVNCHYSLLPDYRGNFVEFWQTMNQDLHTAGVTFHLLADSVDSGDIIASVAHQGLPDEITPFDLQYRNHILMLEHYPRVVKSVLEGRYDRRKQSNIPSRAYRIGDITDELRRKHYRRLGLL